MIDDEIQTIEDRAGLIRKLQQAVGSSHVLTEEEQLHPFECDGLSAYRQLPLLVVLPETTTQVQDILRICRDAGVPVIARGAGTGLSGGALPREDAVLLSLARFDRILELSPQARTATVQPGVRNIAISEAADEFGLYYAPDPSSQIACSIGGNVAENAGGVHCLKYGLTTNNILALKMVTIDGELLSIGSQALDSPGYDLLSLMTGSEGMLGVIVEITVKLTPKPEQARLIMAAFDDLGKAAQAVSNIISAGIIPAGLEMMDHNAIQAAEAFAQAGYPTDAEAILLCEIDGSAQAIEQELSIVSRVFNETGATGTTLARDNAERLRLWAGRKAAFPAVGRLSPDYYCMDGTIPRRELPRVLDEIARMSEKYQLRVANVFHAGDGNLHPLILFDANLPDELETAEKFGAEILELCVAVGGSITGEHGVGMEKIGQMCVQYTDNEREQFHRIKEAFDPSRLLNPGKAIPTLHRCAELGFMHVHHGELPFPELERF